MPDCTRFYIGGAWVEPASPRLAPIIHPATEREIGKVAMGTAKDVDAAVGAARRAFERQASSSRRQRLDLLRAIMDIYDRRIDEVAQAISQEMGAPLASLARARQAPGGLRQIAVMAEVLERFEFQRRIATADVVREPMGVCALITPWNWPINQIACKIAPALAAGCTMVLKPSELAPLSADLMAEILHEAGVPAGVFNMVHGDGPEVGAALVAHPEVDMVSFTGSTRAGKAILKAAADTVKKVSLELGGKSANILTEDADLPAAVAHGVETMLVNAGQNCNAPSRMLVPVRRLAQAEELVKAAMAAVKVGAPDAGDTTLGPLANKAQFNRVRRMIARGTEEGARLVTGGLEHPGGVDGVGYYVQPTVFSDVDNRMDIAREEIFGPVLCMIPYRDLDEAVRIANDTPYGLSGYVYAATDSAARAIAARLRTGNVHLNGARMDVHAPFGGYKQSGLGREMGVFGLEEFLEAKSIFAAA